MIELVEYFCAVLMGNIPEKEKVPLIGCCVDEYVKNRKAPSIDYDVIQLSGSNAWGAFIAQRYAEAVRQFIIAHEMAHLIIREQNNDYSSFTEDQLKLKIELEADCHAIALSFGGAFHLEIPPGSTLKNEVLMAVSGPAVALSLFMLLSASRRHYKLLEPKGHPSPLLRLSLLFRIVEKLKQSHHSWLGQRAYLVCGACCEQCYPHEITEIRSQDPSRFEIAVFDFLVAGMSDQADALTRGFVDTGEGSEELGIRCMPGLL
jgi:hypothetical protein